MTQYITIMDWLINKPIKITGQIDISQLNFGDMIIYQYKDEAQMFGSYLGYDIETDKTGSFVRKFDNKDIQNQQESQSKAKGYFDIFKPLFKKYFPQAKPVNGRLNLQGNGIYFYFYCEDRLDFKDFIKIFRQHIPINFFFYQVGARDMIRLHPDAKKWLVECGCGPAGCCGTGVLPTVDMDNLVLQGLEGRDIEKLKGHCGKLKCSIVYERYIYEVESKKFPMKGDTITMGDYHGRCIGFNIMNGEVVGRDFEKNQTFRGHVDTVTEIIRNQKNNYIFEHLGLNKDEIEKLKE